VSIRSSSHRKLQSARKASQRSLHIARCLTNNTFVRVGSFIVVIAQRCEISVLLWVHGGRGSTGAARVPHCVADVPMTSISFAA
jgi:hypothetical protein